MKPAPPETEKQTAKREIKEEIGISVNFVPNFKETIRYNIPGDRQKNVVLFLAECIQLLKTNDGEIENYFWLSPEEAKTTLPEWYRPVIEKSEYSLRVDF